MSTDSLPSVQPCTNPRHTGEIRERLGCVGPDPAELTPEEAALHDALKDKVRELEAQVGARRLAAAYRAAADEAHDEGSRLYDDMGQKAAEGAWKIRDLLRRRDRNRRRPPARRGVEQVSHRGRRAPKPTPRLTKGRDRDREDRRTAIEDVLLPRLARGVLLPAEAALLDTYVREEIRVADATRKTMGETTRALEKNRDATDTAVREAEETTEEHRIALSEALGLGNGASWDAIHDRAGELYAKVEQGGPQPAPDPAPSSLGGCPQACAGGHTYSGSCLERADGPRTVATADLPLGAADVIIRRGEGPRCAACGKAAAEHGSWICLSPLVYA
ncbi:hypothetical protein [Streptomyces sp. NPDC001635]